MKFSLIYIPYLIFSLLTVTGDNFINENSLFKKGKKQNKHKLDPNITPSENFNLDDFKLRLPSDTDKKKTILVVLAHADDEFFISPLLSKYNNQDIYWVVAANGDLGTREHANIPAGDSLKTVRRIEALCSARKLKINDPIFLNYGDGKINVWENFYPIHEKIDSLYNLLKPDAIITWGPEGGYGHPDHRMIGNITTEVFQEKPSTDKCQLFYYALPKSSLKSITTFKTEGGEWLTTSMLATDNKYLTYRIPYSKKDLELGLQAFYCNKSQFTPDEIKDVFRLVSISDTIFLKPYHNTDKIKYDIFK